MADSTLAAIKNKTRRITRSLTESQLTDIQLNDYINTFVLYDFPEQLRLFNLRSTLTFYTEPYIDVYETNTADPTNPLYDFKNRYLTVHPPIFIAGYQALFVESREQFYGIYPQLNSIASIGITGNGIATRFTGVINTQQSIVPNNATQQILLLRNNVLFSSIDSNGNGLALTDVPISPTIGNLRIPNQPPTSTTIQDPDNYINYVTGRFVITFPTAPATGAVINSQTLPVQPALPQTMLFYDGQFTLRPVPDQPYRVDMEVFVQPTELLNNTDHLELNEWWQYISLGSAIKIFQDRMDMESVQLIMPEFKNQERLILRRTIVQQTSQRTPTIFTQDNGAAGSYGPGWFSGGGTF